MNRSMAVSSYLKYEAEATASASAMVISFGARFLRLNAFRPLTRCKVLRVFSSCERSCGSWR
jgi:hypothetical protein